MFLYQIIAFSEADHKVCFMEYHCCPDGVPDTPEEAVKFALKWCPELGTKIYKDVRFWVKTMEFSGWEQIIIGGVGRQEPNTVAFRFTAKLPDTPLIPAFSINDELNPVPTHRSCPPPKPALSINPEVEINATGTVIDQVGRDGQIIHEVTGIDRLNSVTFKPRNKGGRPRKIRK